MPSRMGKSRSRSRSPRKRRARSGSAGRWQPSSRSPSPPAAAEKKRSRSRSPTSRRSRSPAARRSRSPSSRPSSSSSSMPPPRLPPPKHNFGNLVDTCKIFLSGLNTKTTEQMLRRLFEKIGDLTDVYVPVEPQTKKPRGFAFVTFERSRKNS